MPATKPVVSVDAVVVGGGLSGLSAATRLRERGVDSVAVLEAQDRVGGRNFAVQYGDKFTFDLGGQWVGPNQDAILRVSEAVGVKTHKQWCTGNRVLDVCGKVSTYKSDIPSGLGPLSLIDLHFEMEKIDKLRKTIDPAEPWKSKNARELDGMTVEQYKKKSVWTEGCSRLIDSMVQGVFGVEPCDLSMLHFLMYVNGAGGIEPLVTIDKGFQDSTFIGGAQQISERLAESLGDRVKLSSAVTLVEQNEEHGFADVHTADCVYRARFVIVACPPAIAGHIRFDPPLPPARRQLMARNFIGSIIKNIVVYPTAFWREKKFSGEVVGDAQSGPVFNVFDDVVVATDGSSDTKPALVLFTNGEAARKWTEAPAEQRKEAAVKQLVRWFGKEAAQYEAFLEKDWCQDPWTSGCPIGIWGPGALTQHGDALRKPCLNIHWAGTETAEKNQGFMDGAVRAGERAAEEVVARVFPAGTRSG